jgi:hypothetical protein
MLVQEAFTNAVGLFRQGFDMVAVFSMNDNASAAE